MLDQLLAARVPGAHLDFPGVGGDRNVARQVEFIRKGARFLTTNSDMAFMTAEASRVTGELRKALGATNRSIMFQFFVEGAVLTLVSGAIGLGGAAGFMALFKLLPELPGFDYPRIIPSTATLAMLSLGLAGIVAGLYPARKASLLQPVEALRKE